MKEFMDFLSAALPWISIGLLLAIFFAQSARKKKNNKKVENYSTEGMALGMCFGVAIGTAFGNNTGIGLTLGMLAGFVIGSCIEKKSDDKDCRKETEVYRRIANCITVSRILFSLCLFLLSPSSVPFAVLYLLCGVTDVLDGFVARKLYTESKTGELLDSAADLFFTVVYAVKILPLLNLPLWIWIWTAIIAVIKVTGIMIASKKAHRLLIEHSVGNKLTGLLLFLLPLSTCIVDVKYGATLVCAVATVTVIKEICRMEGRSENEKI